MRNDRVLDPAPRREVDQCCLTGGVGNTAAGRGDASSCARNSHLSISVMTKVQCSKVQQTDLGRRSLPAVYPPDPGTPNLCQRHGHLAAQVLVGAETSRRRQTSTIEEARALTLFLGWRQFRTHRPRTVYRKPRGVTNVGPISAGTSFGGPPASKFGYHRVAAEQRASGQHRGSPWVRVPSTGGICRPYAPASSIVRLVAT